ncbi:MAG: amidohydrolase family protein [Thiomargarita sp.]|nr:amidohydrolase family protein [Thiomargarita sp.]
MITKTKIPLLKDHHSHPFLSALLSDCINLKEAQTKEEALSIMRKGNKDEINIILGWSNHRYLFEEHDLDQLPPIIICNTSFHCFLINRATKEKLGNSHQAILTNINDEKWVEQNLPKILKFIGSFKPFRPKQVKTFYRYLLQQGVWFAEEMLLPFEWVIPLFKEKGYFDRTRFWANMEMFHSLNQETQKDIYGIKVFTDGALGSKTAALKVPYSSGEKGVLVYSDEELHQLIDQIAGINKAIALHAIGDRAIAQIVTVLSKINDEQGGIPPTRIEHSILISQHDAQKAKSLGITLSMQPNFSIDSTRYQDRLSERYYRQINPFRMLIDDIGFVPGEDLVFGSDGLPYGVQTALEMALFPPLPSQVLTLDEFVGGYCMPSQKNGFIEVTIDEEKRSVLTKIRGEKPSFLKKWGF